MSEQPHYLADDARQEFEIDQYLLRAIDFEASDLHLQTNDYPWLSINGDTVKMDGMSTPLGEDQIISMMRAIAPTRWIEFTNKKRLDFAHKVNGIRFRCHYAMSKGAPFAVFRRINDTIPSFQTLGLPANVLDLTQLPSGIVLFVGVTGSGKSTSLASLEDDILKNQSIRMITIESPIEYELTSQKSLVTQREVGRDVDSFGLGIEDAMREAPDVIQIGEMRDPETMQAAIRAATSGHLVFSTMHCESAADAPTRILDAMPGDKINDVRAQLSRSLKAVVYQRLLPRKGGGKRVLAYEVMIVNTPIANMIRNNDLENIQNQLTMNGTGCVSFEQSLASLVREGKITEEVARRFALRDVAALERYMNLF